MKRRLGLGIVLVLLAAMQISLLAGWAAAAEPTEVSTRLDRVALFKNGLAFVVRQGQLPATAGPLVVDPLPVPMHGTFWVSYPTGVGLRDVAARESVRHESVQALSIAELLRANVGKAVTLWTSGEDAPPIAGTILAFPTDRKAPRADPYVAGPAPPTDRYRSYPTPMTPRLVLIKTSQGVTAIDPNGVRRLDFGGDAAREFDQEQPAVALHATLDKPAAGKAVSLTYLCKGMTWAPSYLVDISDPRTARLSCKAILLNEVEDLQAAHVDLVTGFPNLMFSDTTSPLALNQTLAQFVQALSGRSDAQRRRSVLTQQAVVANYGEMLDEGGGPMPTYPTAAAGRQAEDLFLYPLEKVTLAKGDVGYYGLFTESVPYRHIYQWEIPDYVSEEDRYGQQRRDQATDEAEVVWHCLRLENTTKMPWTTAPAETVQGDQILGQDILRYTNPGSETVLKITQALGVRAEQRELEIERESEVVRMHGYHYDRVTLKGELRVTNFKDEAITLEISKTVSGELQTTSPQADITKLARGLRRVNPTSLLKWTLDIPAGESKDLTYSYLVLVRR